MPDPQGDRVRALHAFPDLRVGTPQLDIYADLLRRWQARINLVGCSTLPDLWWRHFADSAQLMPYMSQARLVVDLGSGAGFPGLVLAILSRAATKPGANFRLIESNTRKAAFLREVSRETGAGVEIVHARAEHVLAADAAPSVVTSRAMTGVPGLLELTRPWLAAGTRGVFLIGQEQGPPAAMADNCNLVTAPSRVGEGFVLEATWCGERG